MISAAVFLFALSLAPFDSISCSGCSCRGGPGYRARDGKCVGWKDLKRKCGDPPETRCADERSGKRSDEAQSDDE